MRDGQAVQVDFESQLKSSHDYWSRNFFPGSVWLAQSQNDQLQLARPVSSRVAAILAKHGNDPGEGFLHNVIVLIDR